MESVFPPSQYSPIQESYKDSIYPAFQQEENQHALTSKSASKASQEARGLQIIWTIETVMGYEGLAEGIKKYVENLNQVDESEKNTQDFFEALNQVDNSSTVDISRVMQSWVNQPGYPVVKAEVVNNGKGILLSQQPFRFLSMENEENSTESNNFLCDTPIFLNQNDSTSYHIVWLMEKELVLEYESNIPLWTMLNHDASGFYRVLYDDQLFQGLLNVLEDNPALLRPLSEAKLLDDYFGLAESSKEKLEIKFSSINAYL